MLSHVASISSCRRSWDFLGLVELFHDLVGDHEQHVTLLDLVRHPLHGLLEDFEIPPPKHPGLGGLLVKIVHLGVGLDVLLVSGA